MANWASAKQLFPWWDAVQRTPSAFLSTQKHIKDVSCFEHESEVKQIIWATRNLSWLGWTDWLSVGGLGAARRWAGRCPHANVGALGGDTRFSSNWRKSLFKGGWRMKPEWHRLLWKGGWGQETAVRGTSALRVGAIHQKTWTAQTQANQDATPLIAILIRCQSPRVLSSLQKDLSESWPLSSLRDKSQLRILFYDKDCCYPKAELFRPIWDIVSGPGALTVPAFPIGRWARGIHRQ